MDVKNEKKAVTVDRKQEMRKKVKKDSAAAAADVKRKPTVQSDTEASASSKPVAQHSSAVASDTSQVIMSSRHAMRVPVTVPSWVGVVYFQNVSTRQ